MLKSYADAAAANVRSAHLSPLETKTVQMGESLLRAQENLREAATKIAEQGQIEWSGLDRMVEAQAVISTIPFLLHVAERNLERIAESGTEEEKVRAHEIALHGMTEVAANNVYMAAGTGTSTSNGSNALETAKTRYAIRVLAFLNGAPYSSI